MLVGDGPVGSTLIWQEYSPYFVESMRLQLTEGLGGGELSCRTRGDSLAHPQTLSFPALSETVVVQKAMDTS